MFHRSFTQGVPVPGPQQPASAAGGSPVLAPQTQASVVPQASDHAEPSVYRPGKRGRDDIEIAATPLGSHYSPKDTSLRLINNAANIANSPHTTMDNIYAAHKLLATAKNAYPEHHNLIAKTLSALHHRASYMHEETGDYTQAIELNKLAYQTYRSTYPEDDHAKEILLHRSVLESKASRAVSSASSDRFNVIYTPHTSQATSSTHDQDFVASANVYYQASRAAEEVGSYALAIQHNWRAEEIYLQAHPKDDDYAKNIRLHRSGLQFSAAIDAEKKSDYMGAITYSRQSYQTYLRVHHYNEHAKKICDYYVQLLDTYHTILTTKRNLGSLTEVEKLHLQDVKVERSLAISPDVPRDNTTHTSSAHTVNRPGGRQ